MGIYTGGMRQRQLAEEASKRIAKQQEEAAAAEQTRKGRAGLFGKIGGALMGAAAVGITGLTGGLAAPLVLGMASSLGKKWADDASKGGKGAWLGDTFKTPGQVDKITAGGKYGYGVMEADEATRGLDESRKSTWSTESMLGDIASSYVTAGIAGDLTKPGAALFKGDIKSAFSPGEGGVAGMRDALGQSIFGDTFTAESKALDDAELDYTTDYGGDTEEIVSTDTETFDEEGYSLDYQRGGQVPQMDQNTLIGLSILAEMANQKKAYDDTPLEGIGQPTIAEKFAEQGKTLGGNNIQSLAQMLNRG